MIWMVKGQLTSNGREQTRKMVGAGAGAGCGARRGDARLYPRVVELGGRSWTRFDKREMRVKRVVDVGGRW